MRAVFSAIGIILLAIASACLIPGMPAQAQDTPAAPEPAAQAAGDPAALAKAAQNPISSMISLPIQYNLNLGVERYSVDKDAVLVRGLLGRWLEDETGPDGAIRFRARNGLLSKAFPGINESDRTQHVVNIQPVYPITVGNVNLINRAILPILYQPIGDDDSEFGLGDLQYTLFLSPAESGRIIWGVGPSFSIPTATDDSLGTGKWSAGPSAVVLAMPGKWVLGALVSNLWSFAGDGDRPDVNALMIQPFINYNMKKGWYLSTSPVITANWNADEDDRWTIPVGAGVGRIFKVGKQPINASLGGYYNIEKPDGAPDATIRLQFQFMFPK